MIVIVFIGALLGAMALGMPVAFALIVSGLAMMWNIDMWSPQIVAQNMLSGADSFTLLAVPFFLFAGELMNAGGISRRIVNAALAWIGHYRGGLGYAGIAAAVVLAALSGSAIADTAAVAALLVPAMRNSGYSVRRSTGLLAAGGVIAPVLPPAIALVLFGVAGGVSITQLFLAGIFPGLLMALSLVITWAIVCRRDNIAPLPKKTLKERIKITADASIGLLLPIVVIGGIRAGIFTPTEAAVIAAVYALLVGLFVYREIKFNELYGLIVRAAKITASVIFLVAAAMVSAWLITAADIPSYVSAMLQPFIDTPILLMFVLMVLVIIVGTALDMAPTILILTPVLMPAIRDAGINPVYFGILFVMNNALGMVTPPVGTVLNVAASVSRISVDDAFKGVFPFLMAEILVMFLLVLFPDLVLVPLRLLMH
ncbi:MULTISPECIES: TRAP transporter large permease [unclassified Rhizobium]|uniref:TRAP transporter large permease n=1 Tax=unclassified Rhizobium TaxID=2613769 RepID=UPI001ADC36C2|nr:MULTISPECIES: TRAP transporter large permease subunit [unclassified Rhizobium]MBO9127908.1 TRAP transporter large permease subunit [Rhizobium sp. 16-488-2b]MBO9178302.1 TRAP transporter large permease subunit [Rhizobium sp. 16-488-2a]